MCIHDYCVTFGDNFYMQILRLWRQPFGSQTSCDTWDDILQKSWSKILIAFTNTVGCNFGDETELFIFQINALPLHIGILKQNCHKNFQCTLKTRVVTQILRKRASGIDPWSDRKRSQEIVILFRLDDAVRAMGNLPVNMTVNCVKNNNNNNNNTKVTFISDTKRKDEEEDMGMEFIVWNFVFNKNIFHSFERNHNNLLKFKLTIKIFPF